MGIMQKPIILLSGGFDPYHDGHAKMFQEAAEIGEICVILNSDDWLIKKKGKNFMSLTERADVLYSIRNVVWVWESKSLDDVSADILELRRHVMFEDRLIMFGKGGDRLPENTPELKTCLENNIPILFGLGGKKKQSSSELLNKWTGDDTSADPFNITELTITGGPIPMEVNFMKQIVEEQRFDG